MTSTIYLDDGQRFKAPQCVECRSWNTYTQGTVQMPPVTLHKCKCRNCGHNWKETSRRESTTVDGRN